MIAYFKEEIPLFRYLWFFIAGIAPAISLNLKPEQWFLSCWIVIFFSLVINLHFTKKFKTYHNNLIPGLLISFLLFLTGFIFTQQRNELHNPYHFSKQVSEELIVTIYETPKLKGDVARFTVKVEACINKEKIIKAKGNLLLAMRFDTTRPINYKYGDQLIIASKFTETELAYNPAEFNYKRYLSYKQTFHQSFINQKQTVKIGSDNGNPTIAFALSFREKQVNKFRKYVPSNDGQSVASTLILGYRADLSQDILDAYSKTGTLHVLSVSGMHVAIVVLLLNLILKPLDRNKWTKLLKMLTMISLIWFYSLICGLAPSILRAALMLTLLLIAQYKTNRVNIFNIIAVSAFIILIINPYSLMDVGFQLSFLAVMGLVYLQPRIYKLYEPENKMLDWIWKAISVSIAAQLATTPISLYYFHQFPVYFILSNLFIAIPAIIIMYAGLGFLLLVWIIPEPLIIVLGYFLDISIWITNKGLMLIEEIPFANITQVWVSKTEIVLCYFLLLILLSMRNKIQYLRVAFLLLISLTLIHTYISYSHIKQHKLIFFSLRKNTAVAYIKGRNALVLTDLDTNEYSYKFSVQPYLDSCRINNLRYINPNQEHGESIYHFVNKKLKIINHKKNDFNTSYSDYLFLSGDKIYNLKHLSKKSKSDLLIDGNNRDFVIKALQIQAQELNLKYSALKRQQAQEINFN